MKRRGHTYSFIFLIIILQMSHLGCEEKTQWDIQPSDESFLIVDGILTNEQKQQTVLLSLSNSEMNGELNYAENANLTVFDGENTFQFLESDSEPGLYLSETEFSGVVNRTYELLIEFEDQSYFASAEMFPVSISDPLPYVQLEDTNLYFIAADQYYFNPDESFMAEVILDWSHVEGYDTLAEHETKAHMYYYHLTTIDVNQIFSPQTEQVLFPPGTYMIQKKYSLSPEHEAFIRSLLSETQWHGGNFDLEEGNVYTNMSDGSLGFFAACSVIADTTFVN